MRRESQALISAEPAESPTRAALEPLTHPAHGPVAEKRVARACGGGRGRLRTAGREREKQRVRARQATVHPTCEDWGTRTLRPQDGGARSGAKRGPPPSSRTLSALRPFLLREGHLSLPWQRPAANEPAAPALGGSYGRSNGRPRRVGKAARSTRADGLLELPPLSCTQSRIVLVSARTSSWLACGSQGVDVRACLLLAWPGLPLSQLGDASHSMHATCLAFTTNLQLCLVLVLASPTRLGCTRGRGRQTGGKGERGSASKMSLHCQPASHLCSAQPGSSATCEALLASVP